MAAAITEAEVAAKFADVDRQFGLISNTFAEIRKDNFVISENIASYQTQTTQTLSQIIDVFNKDKETIEDEIGKVFAAH